ncbi:MAG: DUF4157 domain-containing protein [Solirubrobacteraceae bacterium]
MPEPQPEHPGAGPRRQTEPPGQKRQPLQTLIETQQPGEGQLPAAVRETLLSPGQPLDARTRQDMEARFGYDFSHVRVHADHDAARSARAVDARAYTVGQNLVFGPGAYQPATESGRRLIAHELAHTVQQTQPAAGVTPLGISTAPVQLARDKPVEDVSHTGAGVPWATELAEARQAFEEVSLEAESLIYQVLGRWYTPGRVGTPQLRLITPNRLTRFPHESGLMFNRTRWILTQLHEILEGQWTVPGGDESLRGDIRFWALALSDAIQPADDRLQYAEAKNAIITRPGARMPKPTPPMEAHQGGMPKPTPPMEAHQGGMPKPTPPMEAHQSAMPERTSPMEAHQGGMPKPTSPMEAHQGGTPEPTSVVPEQVAPAAVLEQVAPGAAEAKSGIEGGAQALLAQQLGNLRSEETAKAYDRLEQLQPQIEEARTKGKWVALKILYHAPDSTDVMARFTGVGDIGQITYFETMWIETADSREQAEGGGRQPAQTYGGATPYQEESKVQPGHHVEGKQVVFPPYDRQGQSHAVTRQGRGFAGTYRPITFEGAITDVQAAAIRAFGMPRRLTIDRAGGIAMTDTNDSAEMELHTGNVDLPHGTAKASFVKRDDAQNVTYRFTSTFTYVPGKADMLREFVHGVDNDPAWRSEWSATIYWVKL